MLKRHIKIKFKLITGALIAAAIFLSMPVFYVNASINDRPKEVKEKLEKILSSGEFTKTPPQKSFIETALDKIGELIKEFFDRIGLSQKLSFIDNLKLSSWQILLLKIFGILIPIFFILFILFIIFRRMKPSKKIKMNEDILILNSLKDYEQVERMAIEFMQKNDFRQGIRFLYIALLLYLNKLNIIKIDKSKTNKQYLREIANNYLENYNLIYNFTWAFNECWYGNKNADRKVFDSWYEKYTSLTKGGMN
jgi:hypothetical protein